MAAMEIKGGKGAPRVDLTPMVDLGFLLITFFMFTTTMSKPTAMEIQMPYKEHDMDRSKSSLVKESTAMTILLSKDHRIYYYYGMGADPKRPPELKATSFENIDGIRDAIIAKKKEIQGMIDQGKPALDISDKLTVMVKPADNSNTEDLINILDEMSINAVPIYAVVDITPEDEAFLAAIEKRMGFDK
ncbi:ExbD/TolR family protein [Edaphocola flava]|uniref:ExbD/TolR family protein n=1 Tax=Edaphocola flava TaxID=2499629 RepID=UPI00100C0B9F|nr:biopolymer transporter ExbD [Edaphocola flava]